MRDYNNNLQNYNYFDNQSFKQRKTQFFIPLYFFFQVLFLFCVIFLLIFQNIRYKDLEKTIYQQVKENRKLDESTLPLQLQIRKLTSNEVLEKVAAEKYNFYPAKREQMIQVEYIKQSR